jgi:hypothetical protein
MLPEVEKTRSKLDEAIDRLLTAMSEVDCSSKEFAVMADQLTKLYKMKDVEETLRLKALDTNANCDLRTIEASLKQKELLHPKRVSPDTLILVAGNILGIVIIISYEKANVITSRAMNFVMKLR